MSSAQSGEGDIRRAMVEGDVVDCMIALPGQLFYSTQIPACLWFLARDKKNNKFRDRRGEVLFIDAPQARSHGGPHPQRINRQRHRQNHRCLSRLRGEDGAGDYEDVPGFCKSATLEETASMVMSDPRPVCWRRRPKKTTCRSLSGLRRSKKKLDEQLAEGEELGALIQAKLEGVVVDG